MCSEIGTAAGVRVVCSGLALLCALLLCEKAWWVNAVWSIKVAGVFAGSSRAGGTSGRGMCCLLLRQKMGKKPCGLIVL